MPLISGKYRTPRSSPRRRRLRDGFARRVARAGSGDGLAEEGGVVAFGGSRGVCRDDFESMYSAGSASPAMAVVVYDDLVAVEVLGEPFSDGCSRLFCPCVDEGAHFGALKYFFSGVFSYVDNWPALFAMFAPTNHKIY